jgi:ParB family transcriptional regulator, chromosome partitioning protein
VSKRALGKGLGALISTDEVASSDDVPTRQTVDIGKIDPAADQPRKHFNDERLQELAESIRNEGIIQPIVVEPNGNRYTIVAGERRYRAAKLAGLAEVPITVSGHSVEKRFLLSLIENLQRENLDPVEEAEAFRTLIDRTGANQETVAKQVGKSRAAVANSIRLLNLPDEMKQSLSDGAISAGHARGLLAISDEREREEAYRRVLDEGLSVREVEDLARGTGADRGESGEASGGVGDGASVAAGGNKKKPVERPVSPQIQGIEQQFIEALGTRVKLKGSLSKGTVEISYFSKDDLQRLYDLFIGESD